MSRVREKALELAITALGYGMPVSDREELLRVAEVFAGWMDPPASERDLNPADGDDYPRLQPVAWGGPEAPSRPERY